MRVSSLQKLRTTMATDNASRLICILPPPPHIPLSKSQNPISLRISSYDPPASRTWRKTIHSSGRSVHQGLSGAASAGPESLHTVSHLVYSRSGLLGSSTRNSLLLYSFPSPGRCFLTLRLFERVRCPRLCHLQQLGD